MSKLIRQLGLIRYEFNREIPADFENMENMLDSMGKKKRHSITRAGLHARLLPEDEKLSRVMESLRQIFHFRDEFDMTLLDGILEELPEGIRDGDVVGNLTHLYTIKGLAS